MSEQPVRMPSISGTEALIIELLEAGERFGLELIDASSHLSLHEMQARLREERGVSAGIGTLWRFFHARAITVKKNRPRLRARPARRQSRARNLV